jgi:hypothetical protein
MSSFWLPCKIWKVHSYKTQSSLLLHVVSLLINIAPRIWLNKGHLFIVVLKKLFLHTGFWVLSAIGNIPKHTLLRFSSWSKSSDQYGTSHLAQQRSSLHCSTGLQVPGMGQCSSLKKFPTKQHLHEPLSGILVRGYDRSCGKCNSPDPLTE